MRPVAVERPRRSRPRWCRRARRRCVHSPGAAAVRRRRRSGSMTTMPSGPPNSACSGSCWATSGSRSAPSGNVGRVGDDEVDPAVEIGQQPVRGDVGGDEFDLRARGVAPGVGQGVGESSTAMTAACGRARASATASAPDPVHRSTITGWSGSGCARAHSSSDSVSGRGNEDTGADDQVERAERRGSGEVLQRDPPRPGRRRGRGSRCGRTRRARA